MSVVSMSSEHTFLACSPHGIHVDWEAFLCRFVENGFLFFSPVLLLLLVVLLKMKSICALFKNENFHGNRIIKK